MKNRLLKLLSIMLTAAMISTSVNLDVFAFEKSVVAENADAEVEEASKEEPSKEEPEAVFEEGPEAVSEDELFPVDIDIEAWEEFEETIFDESTSNLNGDEKKTFHYTLNQDGNAIITGYEGAPVGNLIIPVKIDGYTVVTIGESAFAGCSKITGLAFENGIELTSIGNAAFKNCTGITNAFAIPQSVTTIGEYAFYNCNSISSIYSIPDTVTKIGKYAFAECTAMTYFADLPKSLTVIEEGVFLNNKKMSLTYDSYNISNVTEIQKYAFKGCELLHPRYTTSDTEFPKNCTSIGESAFEGCSTLCNRLIISENITTLGTNAFKGCTGFIQVHNDSNYVIDLKVIDKVSDWATIYYRSYAPEELDLDLHELHKGKATKLSAIYRYKLDENNEATLIDLGSMYRLEDRFYIPSEIDGYKVVAIGEKAGINCSGNLDLVIPEGIKRIGKDAFYGSMSGHNYYYGNLSLPSTLEYIGDGAFLYGDMSGDLVIPDSVTYIGASAFSDCRGFSSLKISKNLKTLGAGAFSEMNVMGDVEIPASVEKIGDRAFYNSSIDGKLIIDDGVKEIGEEAFYRCSIYDELVLPDSIVTIAESAFESAGCGAGLTLSSGLTEIADKAFYYNQFSGNLIIPEGVKTIGAQAFYNSYNFDGELVLPESLESIGEEAFAESEKLSGELKLPSNIKNIGDGAFLNCYGFSGDLTIPSSLKSVNTNVFAYCDGLNGKLVISDGVEGIAKGAFSNCSFTGELQLPNSLNHIGGGAFSACGGLTGNLTIPKEVYIEDKAFENCKGFSETLTVPAECALKGNPFVNCIGINKVINNSTNSINLNGIKSGTWKKENAEEVVSTISSGTAVYVPTENDFLYTIDENSNATIIGIQKNAVNNLVIPETIDGHTVTAIGKYAFTGMNKLTGTLTIPNTVTLIDNYAFTGCSGFTGNLVLPTNLSNIGYDAFKNCSGFTGDVIIPELEYGNALIFNGCKGIERFINKSKRWIYVDLPMLIQPLATEGGESSEGNSNNDDEYYRCTLNREIPAKSIGVKIKSDETENYEYAADNDGNAVITGFCGEIQDEFTIPEKIDGLTVTGIGQRVFERLPIKGDLTIPDTVKCIDENAFYGCSKLTGELKLPRDIQYIGRSAFENCSGFSGDCVLPNGLKYIEYSAWEGCEGIESFEIPASLEGQSHVSFSAGKSLNKVVNHSDISVYIGDYNFVDEDTLEKSYYHSKGTIRKSTQKTDSGISYIVTTKGDAIITYIDKLLIKDLYIPKKIGEYPVTGIAKEVSDSYAKSSGMLTIPKSVKKIHRSAFYYLKGFTKVVNNSSVEIDLNGWGDSYPYKWKNEATGEEIQSITNGIAVSAGYEETSEYSYEVGLDSTVTLTGYNGKREGNLIIPNDIHKCPVAVIDDATFAGITEFTGTLSIPASVTKFDDTKLLASGTYNKIINLSSVKITLPEVSGKEWRNVSTGKVVTEIVNGTAELGDIAIEPKREVESFSFNIDNITLNKGDNYTVSYTIQPREDYIDLVTFESSDSSVATVSVSDNIVISAVKEGETTISALTDDNTLLDSCLVTVSVNDVPVVPEDPENYGDVREEDIPASGVIPTGVWIAGINAMGYEYTGSAIKPVVRVYDHKTLMTAGKDYTLSYADNVNASDKTDGSKPIVKVKGKGNYSETIQKSFTIHRKPLGDNEIYSEGISVETTDMAYTGNNVHSKPVTVKFGNAVLKEGRDYELSFPENAKEIGKVTLRVLGLGNYTGTIKTAYKIYDGSKKMSDFYIESLDSCIYTGNEIKPNLKVKSDKNAQNYLVAGKDYLVEYSNNVNVGTASAIVRGAGDYALYGGYKKITYKINKKDISNAIISITGDTRYSGKALKPDIIVKDGDTGLVIPAEYFTAKYSSNVSVPKAGTAEKNLPTIKITGKKNYTGVAKTTFEIQGVTLDPSLLTAYISDVREDDTPITVDKIPVSVKYGKATLKRNKDYELVFTRDIGKTVQSATIRFIGNYAGEITREFLILKDANSIQDITLSIEGDVFEYTGTPIKPQATVKGVVDGKDYVLIEGQDYKLSYSNNKKVTKDSIPSVKAIGLGAYSGQLGDTCNFTIIPKTLNDEEYTIVVSDIKATGKPRIPSFYIVNNETGKKLERKAYKYECINNVEVSEKNTENAPTLIVSGNGNYIGTIQKCFRIYEIDIASCTAASIAKMNYTGNQIKPSGNEVQIYENKNKTGRMTEGVDYVLEYAENTGLGKGTVYVHGIGKFGGTKKLTFKIIPRIMQ